MAEVYDPHGQLAYALIFRILRNAAVSEDLVQEAFLRVWNSMNSFDQARGSLRGWVLAVARNVAIDYLRSREGRLSSNSISLDREAQLQGEADVQ